MKWNGLTVAMSVVSLLGVCLSGTADAQTRTYRTSGRVIASPATRTYQAGTQRVNYTRKYYGPTVSEPIATTHDHGIGCGRCCPAIIPTLLNGISNALDCLLPCRSCGVSRGCDDCGKRGRPAARAPVRSYRSPCGGCGLGILPLFSYRFNQGSYCDCYGNQVLDGIPGGQPIPTEAIPEEVIPKPIPDKEVAPRSARRLPAREEIQRYRQPDNDALHLAPPRASTPRSLPRYGRIVETRATPRPAVVRTGYSRNAAQEEGLRTSAKPRNPLR